MNIAFLVSTDYPWRSGGVNQALHNLVTFLGSRGHHVDVYALENFSATGEPIFEVGRGVRVVPVPAPLLLFRSVPVLGGIATLATVLRLPGAMVGRINRAARPDVVVADFTCATAALRWGGSTGVPVAVLRWAHWADELAQTGRLFGMFKRHWVRTEDAVFRAAECIVVDGPDLIDDAAERGVGPERVCLVPSSVSVERFERALPDFDALKRAGLADGSRVLLFPSMLRDIKGFDHLLRAFARLPQPMQQTTVIAATGRENQETYRELAKELGIETSVVFLGELAADDLPPLFAASYAAVFPYLFGAGYSVAGIEAMAAGLPLVAYDVQAFSAIVENGVTGLLVKGGDVDALAAALESMLADEDARVRMGAEAQVRSHDFDVAAVGTRFERVLDRLVAGESPCG